ncbi:hypothetical protein [Cellulomonas sp. P5_C5]
MTQELLTPGVVALAEEVGLVITQSPDGETTIASFDVQDIVSIRDGVYVVEHVERGVLEGRDLATDDLLALNTFLIVRLGQSLRHTKGLGRLRVPLEYHARGPVALPAGRSIDEVESGYVVRWAVGDVIKEAHCFSRADAYGLAGTVGADIGELIASFRDTAGLPLLQTGPASGNDERSARLGDDPLDPHSTDRS